MTSAPGPGRSAAALTDLLATATGTAHRDDPALPKTGGPAGNARLTAWTGLLLLVFFLVESATLISVGHFITLHILIGAFLIPLVLLKTVTTGWRIARYYRGSADYRQAGPPPMLLRLLGPLVVLSGLAVLGSGLSLVALGSSTFSPIVTIAGFSINALTIHQASFAVWLVATGLHVLARTVPAVKVAMAGDAHRHAVPGVAARAAVLSATLLAGVAASVLVLHLANGWTDHHVEKFRHIFRSANHEHTSGAPAGLPGDHVVVRTGQVLWRLPAPVSRMIALPDAGDVLLAGGLNSLDTSTNQVELLDVRTGRVHVLGTVPDAFHDAAAVTIAGHAVIFGGGSTTSTDTVQSFAESKARKGFIIGRLPQPRSDLAAATVGNRVYVLGGYTGTTALTDVLETTRGTSFRAVATLPVTVRYAAVTAIGSTIWVVGGEHANKPVRAIQRIDTTTGTTSVVGFLPRARTDASAMVIAGRVLIAGGRGPNGRAVRTVDELDASGTSVREVARLLTPVADAAHVVIGGTGYLIGGEEDAPTDVIQFIAVTTVPNRAGAPPA